MRDLAALLEGGKVPAHVAVAKLGDAEREMLSSGVADDGWVPLAAYDRMCQLLLEYDGRGKADYFVVRGRNVAERLIAAGAFKQVELVRRLDRESSFEQVALYMRLAGTIWSSVFNFASFRLLDDDVHYGFEIADADPISDMLAESILGFMMRVAEEADSGEVHIAHSRPREDLLCYLFRFGDAAPVTLRPRRTS